MSRCDEPQLFHILRQLREHGDVWSGTPLNMPMCGPDGHPLRDARGGRRLFGDLKFGDVGFGPRGCNGPLYHGEFMMTEGVEGNWKSLCFYCSKLFGRDVVTYHTIILLDGWLWETRKKSDALDLGLSEVVELLRADLKDAPAPSSPPCPNAGRLAIDIDTGTATLDGETHKLEPRLIRLLDIIHLLKVPTKIEKVRYSLKVTHSVECNHNNTYQRWKANLPERFRNCIKGKQGVGIWFELPDLPLC